MNEKVSATGIVFVNGQGEVLLHQRDSRPGLLHAGCWDVIGGQAETGEEPLDTARRETLEEIGEVVADELEFFAVYQTEVARIHVFVASLDKPADSLMLGEGQDLRFFAPDDLALLDLVPWNRAVFRDFLSSPAYARRSSLTS